MSKIKNLTGQKFGRLTATRPTKKRKNGCVIWLCRCSCGRATEVRSQHLLGGRVHSCGCLRKERARQRLFERHIKYREWLGDDETDFKDNETNNNSIYYPDDQWPYVVDMDSNYEDLMTAEDSLMKWLKDEIFN